MASITYHMLEATKATSFTTPSTLQPARVDAVSALDKRKINAVMWPSAMTKSTIVLHV